MQKSKKPNFLSWNINVLLSSLKKIRLKDIALILFLDALLYIFSGYIFLFWLRRISEKMESVYLPSDLASAGIENVQQAAKDTQSFYYIVIFSLLLLIAAIIFLSSIIKGAIWARTVGAKITSKLISKFFMLNFLWLGFWLLLMLLILLLVEEEFIKSFMLGALMLSAYFTGILYAVFMRSQKIMSFANALKLGASKIHIFALPYLFILGFFYLALLLGNLAKIDYYTLSALIKAYSAFGFDFSSALEVVAPQANFLIVLIISLLANPFLLVSAAISRYYVSALVMELSKPK